MSAPFVERAALERAALARIAQSATVLLADLRAAVATATDGVTAQRHHDDCADTIRRALAAAGAYVGEESRHA